MRHAAAKWLALAAFFVSGCGGASALSDTETTRVMTAPLVDVMLSLRALCDSGCERSVACGEVEATFTVCHSYCAERFDATDEIDVPTTRACLNAERLELRCFAALSCEERALYFAGEASDGALCESLDRAAIAACSR